MTGLYTDIYAMEPMLPNPGDSYLEELAAELIRKSSELNVSVHKNVTEPIGHLVRSMNCYYSNLIEGHNTHPRDIEKALEGDFNNNVKERNLQLEAIAHIAVQKHLEQKIVDNKPNIFSKDFICSIHEEFYKYLPEEFLFAVHPDNEKKVKIEPGKLRDGNVQVGYHLAPDYRYLSHFLERFEKVYASNAGSLESRVIALAASHHRLLWIHPFYDGNGRVVRLFSHCFALKLRVGSSLWSVSRGLARNAKNYKSALMAADNLRYGDLDGRGNLSLKGLNNFCEFFLKTCIDQVEFMIATLDLQSLLRRIESFVDDEIRGKRLPKGSFYLLKEALTIGEVSRGSVASLTGYKERQARTVLKALVDRKLLKSGTARGSLMINFSAEILERWFPRLFPI